VVETHSEYIVTRLRLRVAQEALKPDAVSVLFAEQIDGETRFSRLAFTSAGDFEHWPSGFFDSIADDTVAIATALRDRFAKPSDE
jgi:predicted ATPase